MDVLIIDDEPEAVSYLNALLQEYCPEITLVGSAFSVSEGIQQIVYHQPDLVFLDIELGDDNDLDILKQFPDSNFKVIFITSHNRHALKATLLNTLTHIIRADSPRQTVSIVNKKNQFPLSSALLTSKPQYHIHTKDASGKLILPTAQGFLIVETKDIIFCKAEGSYVDFFLADGRSYLVSRQLWEYEGILESYNFLRIHRSYLANLQMVREFIRKDGGYVIMENGATLPVASAKKESFLQKINGLFQTS